MVTLCGKDHYLGRWNTKASRNEYDRLIGEWLAAGRIILQPDDRAGLTDRIRALELGARRRLERFRDCFKKSPVFEHFLYYSLGLLAQFERKSIEPIALWIGVAVRTLQLFLSQFVWDHGRIESRLRHMVMDEYGCDDAIGVIDASAHAKQGGKTPGVQRQWCGKTGKIDNCAVGQHLIYTNNDPKNPFAACVASDLYLPQCWIDDAARRVEYAGHFFRSERPPQ